MKGANAMTEEDKYLLKKILPKHYADICIIHNISISELSPLMIGHLNNYESFNSKEAETQIQDITQKDINKIISEELQKSIQQILNK